MSFVRKLYYTLKALADHPLKRHAPLRSAFEFCTAQVAVRFIPGDIAVPFPNDTRLVVSPRMKGAAHFISPGLCEFDEMSFVAHFLRAPDLFADIGANVGAYSVLASGISGARTFAFEPSPGTFRYLLDNIRLNNLAHLVTALNVALGRQEGTLLLTDNLGTENYVCPNGESHGGVSVKVTSIDQTFSDCIPQLMKVDVEGFETEVFGGAKRILGHADLEAMIVERGGLGARYGYDEAPMHASIQSQGFTPCTYSGLERRLSRATNNTQGNIIYVRNLEKVQARLRSAPPFRFSGKSI